MAEQERVTLKSIAQELGVSFSTVARALNGDPRIHPQTRKLVEDKAQELNYTRNYYAQTLRRNEPKSKTVAIIMDVADSPVFTEILAMISAKLATHGYTTLVFNSHDSDAERKCIQTMLSRIPEAVIISMSDPASENLQLLQSMFDRTLVLGSPDSSVKTSFISLGHRQAGYLSAQHMLSCGNHRNLIFCNYQGVQAGQLFLEGIRNAYADNSMVLDESNIIPVSFSMDDASQKFCHLWQERQGMLDGVICDSDSMAFGVYQAAQQLGLTIPEDISVIGYDDSRLNSFTAPPLTSIHTPKDQVVEHCLHFLLGRLLEEDRSLCAYHLEPHLSVRNSVAQRA